MMVESIDDPDQIKQGTLCKQSIFHQYEDFDHFVAELGELNGQNLKYSECNKFLKLKQTDYVPDHEVIEYFKQIFIKKTSTTVRRKWHIKDKFILAWVVFKLCYKKGVADLKMNYKEWQDVETILKLPKEFLMRKWICLIRHTTIQSHWTTEEEEILKRSMENNSLMSKWSDLAIAVYSSSKSVVLRTCKDIRQHWKNYLDPRLKKAIWTQQQDFKLLQLIGTIGKKWSTISKKIQGRTENQVKNRYLALLKKDSKNKIRKIIHTGSSSQQISSQQQQSSSEIIKTNFVQYIKLQQEYIKFQITEYIKLQMPLYGSQEQVNESELQDYIHIPIYKKSHDQFFIDN